jgi:hypothetical protein
LPQNQCSSKDKLSKEIPPQQKQGRKEMLYASFPSKTPFEKKTTRI